MSDEHINLLNPKNIIDRDNIKKTDDKKSYITDIVNMRLYQKIIFFDFTSF